MPYNTTAIPPRKEPTGQTQLPPQDPDVVQCSNNAAFVITCATVLPAFLPVLFPISRFWLTPSQEMFIQHLAEAALNQAKTERKPRRNIQYKDVGTSLVPRDTANAVAHQDNLEFLEDVAPKTIPLKKVHAASRETQARIRGEKAAAAADDDTAAAAAPGPSSSSGQHRRRSHPHANGAALVNGNGIGHSHGAAFSVALRNDDRAAAAHTDDPNEQLEMEMRQAAGSRARDGDVHMSG
ncbi:histone-fold protein [Purpureocillium lavendulum]|uniref:Histone-fold protein n=1 Tax=Purpureocillium lavendulum TaxID=1247861 RepID=A0AB34FY24_9HYPO|nr:histone-fold protein [Purpureocillium lavendulum]